LRQLALSDEELVRLWYCGDTVDDLAYEYEVDRQIILREWKRLRSQGTLPQIERAAVCEGNGGHHDGRPRVDMLSYHDELLEALIREHGEPRFDIYPGK
jgi:hypothetical protein